MVHVRDPRVRWNVPAHCVVRIVSAAEWGQTLDAATVLDPLAALGAVPIDDDHRHRVIVLRGEADRELAVIAAGAIQIVDVEAQDVLALPPEVARVAAFTALVASRSTESRSTESRSAESRSTDAGALSLVIDPIALAPIALTPLAPPVIPAASVRNHA